MTNSDGLTRPLGADAPLQDVIDAESEKLESIDPDSLGTDAAAIVKALSAVTGMLAAVAIAVDRAAPPSNQQDREDT